MTVIELISQLQAHDIQLYLEDEKLKVNAPKGAGMQDWLVKIKTHKPEIIAFLKRANKAPEQLADIPILDRQSALPLSFSQQRLWFIDQLQHDASYNMAGAFDIKGALNITALEKAFTLVIERQEQLRINFISQAGQAEIKIRKAEPWLLNLQKTTAAQLPQQLDDFKSKYFDLESDSLVRTQLYQLEDDHRVLAIAMHHIISDAWSLGVFTRELAFYYHQMLEDKAAGETLFPLEIQYIDYAAWQREKIQGQYLQSQLDYWQKQLANCPVLELPIDYPRAAHQQSQADRFDFKLNPETTEKLKQFSQENGVTVFTTLLAAYKVLLYRSTGQDDICVGVPSSFRQSSALEHLIGFFINSLPIRSDLSASPSFLQSLEKINATRLKAEQYQELPFEQLLEHLGLARDLSHSPIFQTMFSLEHRSKKLSLPLDGLETTFSALENEQTKFDLTLTFFEDESGLSGEFEYNRHLFNSSTISAFAKHLSHILDDVLENPHKAIDEISLLDEQEKQVLIEQWSGQQVPIATLGLIDLFERQVAQHQNATAIEEDGQCFTYGDLQQRANKLANYLLANGLQEKDVVAIFCARGYELVVAMLAVVKAGGIYLPIDISTPDARLKHMVEDAEPRFVLSQERIIAAHENSQSILPNIVRMDSDWRRVVSYSASLDVRPYAPQAPVYIIYTSGSTGLPKGVVVPEVGICNLASWHAAEYFQQETVVRMGQVAGAAFDAAAWEIWATLCAGASLIIAPEDARISAKEMVGWIAENEITHLFLPTPLAEAVFAEPLPQNWLLKTLFTGGDKLNQFPPQQRSFKLINAYGPTECSVVATAGEIKSENDHGGLPPIGRPINNAHVYILDKTQQVVPVGVMGELYIGGTGVAKGYLNNEELNEEKFLKNPYASGKLYRTGDLARWLANGEIAYCGRIDQQVQVRGFRVELGEIENALNKLPGIKESLVRLNKTHKGKESLSAYLVMSADHKASFDKNALTRSLKNTLPDYMLPGDYCVIDAIPLTANGKIDDTKLPPVSPYIEEGEQELHFEAPSTQTEKDIFEIWESVLGNAQFGVENNFFQIGGHSLLATRVMARIREEFNKNLPLRLIFDNPSITELAEIIDGETTNTTTDLPALLPVSRDQPLSLSFSQERLWVLDRLESGASKYNNASAYNISSAFNVRGKLHLDALSFAFSQLVKRHEILRTTFSSAGAEVAQCITPAYSWLFTIEDVCLESEQRQLDAIALLQQQETSRAFDLEEGADARRTRLIRTRLLKRADDHFVLFITLHHIIADGWSVEIISQELSYFYRQYLDNGETLFTPLPELAIQYADYAMWQKQCLQEERIQKPLAYWQQHLAGVEALELTTDYPRPSQQTYAGAALNTHIPEALAKKIQQFSKQEGLTPFVALICAYKILLSRYSGQADLCVGTPLAQRPVQETEALIGFFINTLPLRSVISEKQSYRDALKTEHHTILDAFEYQDIPFERIVEALNLPRDLSRSPVFQTLFSFQKSDLQNSLKLQGLQVEQLPQKNTASQFEISLAITETQDGLLARYDYNTSLFSEKSIERFSRHFENVLDSLLENPDCALSDINFLSQQEYQQQIIEWNNTEKEYPKTEALHALFEQQARQTPDSLALCFEQQELSYAELNRQANQLAHFLIASGADRNQPVAVCMQRSVELVICLYAILKSGAAYLPLDTSSPQGRLQDMLDDAGALILITDNDAGLPTLEAKHKVIYADIQENIDNQPKMNPAIMRSADDLAYVIYTSGSTGKPKGVAVPHRGVINRLLWMQDAYPLTDKDVVLQKTPYSFDVSVWEFFWPLFTGAKLVVAKPDGHKDPDYLCQLIQQQQVSTLHFVPSMLGLFLSNNSASACRSLQTVFCSGEALKVEHSRQFFSSLPNSRLINLYGPTEASIDVSVWECKKEHAHSRIPIGKPIANTQLYILNEFHQPVATGVPGELYIGGAGLAKGYLGQATLTAERFIDSPFANTPGEKLYKTGDKVRFLPDGNIDYLGRMDFQVKLRGLRIELGEIENQLESLAFIKESVVVMATHNSEQHLVAYISSDEEVESVFIKKLLANKLPDYMLPSAIIKLAELPLSPNGKVDRKALPLWQADRIKQTVFVAPRNASEVFIAQLWCDFLKLDTVGVLDNFFELGGHSLLATQIVSRIRERYEVEISLAKLFEKPTVEALAMAVLEAEMADMDEAVLVQLLEEI